MKKKELKRLLAIANGTIHKQMQTIVEANKEIAELKDKIESLCKMYEGIIDVGEAEIKRRTIIMHYLETKDLD